MVAVARLAASTEQSMRAGLDQADERMELRVRQSADEAQHGIDEARFATATRLTDLWEHVQTVGKQGVECGAGCALQNSAVSARENESPRPRGSGRNRIGPSYSQNTFTSHLRPNTAQICVARKASRWAGAHTADPPVTLDGSHSFFSLSPGCGEWTPEDCELCSSVWSKRAPLVC